MNREEILFDWILKSRSYSRFDKEGLIYWGSLTALICKIEAIRLNHFFADEDNDFKISIIFDNLYINSEILDGDNYDDYEKSFFRGKNDFEKVRAGKINILLNYTLPNGRIKDCYIRIDPKFNAFASIPDWKARLDKAYGKKGVY